MCIFVSEYSCERVFILQNRMRKKYPSEEGTGLYVFVADDYMALPDDTEPFHLPAVLLSKLFSKTCVTRIASIFLRIDKLSTGICQRLSGGLFLPCCKVLREV